MKNVLHKIILLLAILCLACPLVGCSAGSTIDTVLTINQDLSGSRVMEIAIDQSVFSESFKGSPEQLQALIAEKCPAELSWTYDNSTGAQIYKFTLEFANVEQYKEKVKKIMGEEANPDIVITKSESIWAKGCYVKENFDSEELLQFFKTAVVEAGFVDESNASYITSLGETSVHFGEVSSTCAGTIDVDTVEYLEIERLDILTEVKGFDSYSETIFLVLPEDTMEAKGTEIKQWLATNLPDGAKAEWKEENGSTSYIVKKEGMKLEETKAFLNKYFITENCEVSHEKIKEDVSPFSFNLYLNEKIDFTNFLVGELFNNTDVNYYVKGADGYVAARNLEDCANLEENEGTSEEHENYRVGRTKEVTEGVYECSGYYQKAYNVKSVEIESKVGLFGNLSRKVVYHLDGIPTDDEKDEIMAAINAYGEVYNALTSEAEEENTEVEFTEVQITDSTEAVETETTEVVDDQEEKKDKPNWKVKIKGKEKGEDYIVTIIQKGDRQELQNSSEALYGGSDFHLSKNYSFAKLKYPIAVTEKVQLGDFVLNVTEDVNATYTLKTGLFTKVIKVDDEKFTIDGNKVLLDGDVLDGVSLVTYGTKLNFWAIAFYALIAISIVSVLMLLKKVGVFTKLRGNKNNIEAAQVLPVPESAQENLIQNNNVSEVMQTEVAQAEGTQEVEEVQFCQNCGAKCDADALVCTQCGAKLND